MESVTADPVNQNFRASAELMARVDAYAERLRQQTPGVSIGRSDAIRALLLIGLSAVEL